MGSSGFSVECFVGVTHLEKSTCLIHCTKSNDYKATIHPSILPSSIFNGRKVYRSVDIPLDGTNTRWDNRKLTLALNLKTECLLDSRNSRLGKVAWW